MVKKFNGVLGNKEEEYNRKLLIIPYSTDGNRAETSPKNIIYRDDKTTFNLYYRSLGKSEMIFKYDNHVVKLLFYSFSNNKYSEEKYTSVTKELVNSEYKNKVISIYTTSELDIGKEDYKSNNLSKIVDEFHAHIVIILEDFYDIRKKDSIEKELFKTAKEFKNSFINEHQNII